MKTDISTIEERQFMTKEFADTLAGKSPAPYLRVHDPVQQALVALAKNELSAQQDGQVCAHTSTE